MKVILWIATLCSVALLLSSCAANTSGRASAKLGLAASYVAISCVNEPGDVETITKLVEPLLNELTKK